MEPLTCGCGSALPVAEPAGSAEGPAFSETGPFLTEPFQVELKDCRRNLEGPLQVPEGSCGSLAACQGAGEMNAEEN